MPHSSASYARGSSYSRSWELTSARSSSVGRAHVSLPVEHDRSHRTRPLTTSRTEMPAGSSSRSYVNSLHSQRMIPASSLTYSSYSTYRPSNCNTRTTYDTPKTTHNTSVVYTDKYYTDRYSSDRYSSRSSSVMPTHSESSSRRSSLADDLQTSRQKSDDNTDASRYYTSPTRRNKEYNESSTLGRRSRYDTSSEPYKRSEPVRAGNNDIYSSNREASSSSSYGATRDDLYGKQTRSGNEGIYGGYSSSTSSSDRIKNYNDSQSSLVTTTTSPGLVGLKNLGNTCFMNSVLQCLSNSAALKQYCCSTQYTNQLNRNSNMKGNLMSAFTELVRQLWSADNRHISPDNFKYQLQRFAPRFVGYNQQDAQEFLRYLLEGLHEDVNRIQERPKPVDYNVNEDLKLSADQLSEKYWKLYKNRDDSHILDLFVGQLCSTLTCSTCKHESMCFDPFWDLSLSIPKHGSPTLMSCIELFMQTETLDGDEKPTCSQCKERRRSTKAFSLQRLPPILVVHLKRFSGERFRSKLGTTVHFNSTLDLKPYMSSTSKETSTTYELYAVSNHSGSCYSGHYTAYAKHPDTNHWHVFDDSSVRSISEEQVVSSGAYVLFYAKVGAINSRL